MIPIQTIDPTLASLFTEAPAPLPTSALTVPVATNDSATSNVHQTRRMLRDEIIEKNSRTVFIGNLPVQATEKANVKALKALFAAYGTIDSLRWRSIAFDAKLPRRVAFAKGMLHKVSKFNTRTETRCHVTSSMKKSSHLPTRISKQAKIQQSKLQLHLTAHCSWTTPSASISPKNRPLLQTRPNMYFHLTQSVFIGNLPFTAQIQALHAFFEPCGEIEHTRIIRDKKTNTGTKIQTQAKDSHTYSLNPHLRSSWRLK
jgi:nucleolar protein 12